MSSRLSCFRSLHMGKIKGIEITDLTIGTGDEALKDSCVAVNARMFLRRGDEVSQSPTSGPRMVIDLGRRECIAGLRYGIPGMRVGGVRQLVIPPHLAYGEAGIPGNIPSNALIRCEVELVGIRAHSAFLPQDHLPGKLLMIHHPDKKGERYSGWCFHIHENGNSSLYFARETITTSENWPQFCQIPITLDPQVSSTLVQQAQAMLSEPANGCLPWESAYIKQAGAAVSDRSSGVSCISIHVMEQGQQACLYAVPINNTAFQGSTFYEAILSIVAPHLQNLPTAKASSA
jgi:hypothetical protein